MTKSCSDSPSAQLLKGIREFNTQEWFECHETVEDLWIGSEGEVRDFYQGIIQIAVALHHWRNGNFGGAVSLLNGGCGYLGKVSDQCQWIDVAALMSEADRMRKALEGLGVARMAELDRSLLPTIKTVSTT